MTLRIAFRNIFRNTRRSLTTLATIAIGAMAVLVFGAYITYIQYGVQTSAVQGTGHLQVFRNGYFTYGTAAPADWGIDHYQDVLRLIREDPELKQLTAVVTPIQSLAGIAGNFENNTSKPFFGTGFVPSNRDRMKDWNEYGTDSRGLKHSGLKDNDLTQGITGTGVVRILGLCDQLHLQDCPPAPKSTATVPEQSINAVTNAAPDFAELGSRDRPDLDPHSGDPVIDLLAATAGGAPNVVTLRVSRVEMQTLKELDDNYVGMNLGLAQNLIYGRGEHKVSGIVIQLKRTEDLEKARKRLSTLFKQHGLDLEIRDFTELNPQYKQIIGMFRSIFAFISAIIAMVVLFTVTNAMGMSVIERTSEIGTSRAMGVRRQGIRKQFLSEGGLLGIMGATLGVAAAYLVAYAINHSGLTWSPPGQVGRVPLRLYLIGAEWLMVTTWIGLLVVSAFAALVPANRAARMVVVDALRHV